MKYIQLLTPLITLLLLLTQKTYALNAFFVNATPDLLSIAISFTNNCLRRIDGTLNPYQIYEIRIPNNCTVSLVQAGILGTHTRALLEPNPRPDGGLFIIGRKNNEAFQIQGPLRIRSGVNGTLHIVNATERDIEYDIEYHDPLLCSTDRGEVTPVFSRQLNTGLCNTKKIFGKVKTEHGTIETNKIERSVPSGFFVLRPTGTSHNNHHYEMVGPLRE